MKIEDIKFKVLVIGPASSGVRSLLMRLAFDKFESQQPKGLDPLPEFVSRELIVDCFRAKVQLFHNARPERFSQIIDALGPGIASVVLVYDVTHANGLEEAQSVLEDTKKYLPPEIKVILLGNKIDLPAEREILTQNGIEFAAKNGFGFFETSAKKNPNFSLERAFERAIVEGLKFALKRLQLPFDASKFPGKPFV